MLIRSLDRGQNYVLALGCRRSLELRWKELGYHFIADTFLIITQMLLEDRMNLSTMTKMCAKVR